jgi:hypothetical protein
MSGSNTPASGKQEKTMSSRLLTMKVSEQARPKPGPWLSLTRVPPSQFMQRAAASGSNRSPSTPIHLPANSPRELNGHSAKRRKLSPSVPQSPDPVVSTPGSLYQSDESRTPLPQLQERSKSFTPLSYGGNAAETPWVLNITSDSVATQQQEQEQPISPQEETLPQEPVLGRRTFGNFKKKSTTTTTTNTAKASSKRKDEDNDNDNDNESLSPGELDEDYEQYGERMHGRQPPSSSAEKSRSKRRKDQDDDRLDTINLKRLKSGGISAASGMRQPGFDARKYKRDKRKG